MFGCYRRTEAADAGTYVSAVALVLTHYSADVVTAITDPFNGLPSRKSENGYSGLPDVADVKQACEDEASRLDRMARYRALGKTEFKRLLASVTKTPGAWANVLLHAEHPRLAEFMARTKAKGTDPRDWKIDERGLHVSLAWLDSEPHGNASKRFGQYTDAELRAMYPPREAADPSHVKQGGEAA